MSNARKRKAPDPKSGLSGVRDLLVQVKPLLHSSSNPPTLLPLLRNLYSQASDLSASLSTGRETLEEKEADELDSEGVGIWNLSGEWKEKGLENVWAWARGGAYALIESGKEPHSSAEGLIRLLELGSKAASALSSSGSAQEAEGLLMKCAAHEDALAKRPASSILSEQVERAKAQTTYFRIRAENAWRRGMLEPGWFMMKKACDDYRLSLLSPREVYPLMALTLEVGSSLLSAKSDDDASDTESVKRAEKAVEWLSLGLRLGDKTDREAERKTGLVKEGAKRLWTSGVVRRRIMLTLARAYVASSFNNKDHLERAEVTLHEILKNDFLEFEGGDLRRARWLRLQCGLQRGASDGEMVEMYRSIIDGENPTSSLVNRIIKGLLHSLHGKLTVSRPVVLQTLQSLLQKVLEPTVNAANDKERDEVLITVVMSLLVHLKSETASNLACKELKSAFDLVTQQGGVELGASACKACQLILWQLGDSQYGAKPPKYLEAVPFYELSLHSALRPSALDATLVHRKTALCFILLQDYDKASMELRQCSSQEAATSYLKLLSCVNQGLEDQAVLAVRALVACQDLDSKLLLLSTQLASDAKFPSILMEVLGALLRRLREGEQDISMSSSLVLARCLIRLTVKQLEGNHFEQEVDNLSDTLVRHFDAALEIAMKARTDDSAVDGEKEYLWLFKQAYNAAVDATHQGRSESIVYSLFELSLSFLKLYEESLLAPTFEDFTLHRVLAAYSSCVARFLEIKIEGEGEVKNNLNRVALERTEGFFALLAPMLDRDPPPPNLVALLEMSQTIRVLRVSFLVDLRDWSGAEKAVEEGTERGKECSEAMFESLAHLLWTNPSCPGPVATRILDRLLNASLDLDLMPSLDRFSRWMRTSVSLLLSEGSSEAVLKALEHVNEAVDVQRANVSKKEMAYPQEESDWLIAVSATEAIKDGTTANLDRAKQWYEAALALLPFSSWGDVKAGKLRSRYGELLERMQRGP